MNKKGAVLHWVVFGLLFALGIFLISVATTDLGLKVKGQWSLTFLEQNYLEAEKELLKLNIVARKIGLGMAQELAEKGGYLQTSSCGSLNQIPLWNKGSDACFPQVKDKATGIAKERLKEELKKEFSEIGFKDNLFFGKGGKKTISSEVGSYTYDEAFVADLGYSFDEYQELEEKSRELIIRCKSENDLNKCLQTLPAKWVIGDCEKPGSVSGRQVPFCVESVQEIKYKFALDFT